MPNMRSNSGTPSPPNPPMAGALASPVGFDLAVVFAWGPPWNSQL